MRFLRVCVIITGEKKIYRLRKIMKYLFFDIECSVVSKTSAKICAFGYCLTDEQFRILKKEDILINPQGSFHLTDRKGEQGLVLPYEYAKFKKYPVFPEKADEIYALLQDEDTLVAGHATMNDVKYLNFESKRFSLPSFRFEFADTQFVYMNKIHEFSRQFGLGAIAQNLGVDFVAHRAVDDAYATMKIAEAICKEEGLTLPQVLEKYEITKGRIENYEIIQTTSTAFAAYKKEVEARKTEREQAKATFHVFVDKAKRRRAKDGALKGKTVCFSHTVEQDLPLAKSLVTAAFAQGAFWTYRAEDCDVYVCFENESGARLKSVQQNGARILTPARFEEFLRS